GAIPARAGSARYRKAPRVSDERVEAPGRSLEPRSNARPRGMTVLVARHQTEFGLQVRLSSISLYCWVRKAAGWSSASVRCVIAQLTSDKNGIHGRGDLFHLAVNIHTDSCQVDSFESRIVLNKD